MAATVVRNCGIRLLSAKSSIGVARVAVVGGGHQIQVATLKATHGEKYPYPEPYPYWKKTYRNGSEFFDRTWLRFNENTKVIMVEGNLAVGKKDFAKHIAKSFDLRYIEPTPPDRYIINPGNGFDPRMLNEMLPPNIRPYDLERFLGDPNPSKGHAGRLQNGLYPQKWIDYSKAISHVLHTGQGVVMVRSPYSDHVFADAMRACGYITPQYHKYYNMMRDNSICELIKPHLTIYLDAPVDTVRQRINERNDAREVKSAVLSDRYLRMIEKYYKEKFLPTMRESGEVMEIDYTEVADETDMDLIVEELQNLVLLSDECEEKKFQEWCFAEHDTWTIRRKKYGQDWFREHTFSFYPPMGCEEVYMSQDDRELYEKVVLEHPALKYAPGWAAELGDNVTFKI